MNSSAFPTQFWSELLKNSAVIYKEFRSLNLKHQLATISTFPLISICCFSFFSLLEFHNSSRIPTGIKTIPSEKYRIPFYCFRGNYSFLNLEIGANSNSCCNISTFLHNKLNFYCGNCSIEESIQGRK